MLGTFAARDEQFSRRPRQPVPARRRVWPTAGPTSPPATAHINAAAGSVADLLTDARQPIKEAVRADRPVRRADRWPTTTTSTISLRTLPDAYQVLARQGLYGDYFGFYLCDAILKVNGKGGQPVFVKLAGQDTGRCTPK